MAEPDALYHPDQGFFGEKRCLEGVPNTQGAWKMQTLHPDGFAGETQEEAGLSGCALV